ncbi:MAG TPA: DMT family transporter [Chitinophagaceae bacterium]|nr:DMT family transporter [Chitinophagaceae bacterium]
MKNRNSLTGIGLASLAALIWAGNFIIARGVYKQIDPVSLAFFRWAVATIIIFPFVAQKFKQEWKSVKRSWSYFFWASLMGISLFNTLVYIAGHYTTAINLALIATTSSPIMSIILARIFLKEKIGYLKIGGLILCISGILFLLSKGDFRNLISLRFSIGDLWALLAAFCFAVYNILVKKKPATISPGTFLFASFFMGTIFLFPFFIWEYNFAVPTTWSGRLIISILYLGLGASVICFSIWNRAIGILGAGRTSLFGNLIPVFSTLGAALILGEEFTWIHVVSMLLVFMGLLLANLRQKKIQ